MGIGYNPKIVTSGLSLYIDAGNVKSYPGTGTAWNDLSGNGNNFSLVNSPTYSSANGGYLYFVTNQYAQTSYQQPSQDTTTSFTWVVWAYPLINSSPPIIGCRNTSLVFTKLTSNRFEYYPTLIGGAMTINVWQSITIVKNNTNFSYYINGVLNTTGTSTEIKTAIPFFVGGDNLAGEYSNSRVSAVKIYNRALTATEVLQNFNALRGRYGI